MSKPKEFALTALCAAAAIGIMSAARMIADGPNATMPVWEVLFDWIGITICMTMIEGVRARAKAKYSKILGGFDEERTDG